MNSADRFEEFEALWQESVIRSGRKPDWDDLSLVEQKVISSEFRRDMSRYGDEDPIGNRMESGLYALPRSSSSPGSRPGETPDA